LAYQVAGDLGQFPVLALAERFQPLERLLRTASGAAHHHTRSRRMVAARAFAKGGLARAAAARTRLCAMAATASQAAFAAKTPGI
jgi:hypothetical protein